MPFTPYNSTTKGFAPWQPGNANIAPPTPDVPTTLQGKLESDPSYGSQVGAEQVAGSKKIAGSVSKGAQDISQGTSQGGLAGAGKAIKGVAEAGFGTITGAAQSVLAPFTPAISKVVNAITPGIRKDNPILAKVYDLITSKLGEWSSAHPDAATLTGDIVNTLLLAVGGGDTDLLKSGLTMDSLKKSLSSTAEDVSTTARTATDTIKGNLGQAKTAVSEFIKGKPEAKILATPESEVKNLSASERKVWFDNQKATIETKATKAAQDVKDSLKKQVDASSKEADALEKQLATASRDKVIELRPKIVKAMGNQSKVYRSLINEAMEGKEGIKVSTDDLNSAIDTQFGDNPAQASAIKDKLGLTEAPTKPLKPGELPTIQAESKVRTVGEIYNNIKSLKQDISTGALKGVRAYTSDDMMTDKAINVLTSFLQKNGVDFSEANTFWSRYAPIRDQLVSEAKPFLQTGTQTKTFASTLSRVARGTDVNNENFINEVEKLLKQPINKENEAIIEKITANQKKEIADKIAAQEKIVDAEMAKDKELTKLDSKQFEIERQARLRTYVKRAIWLVLGAKVAQELGITKFVGL